MVIGLRNGFPFDLAGICSGDIIVSVNRKKIVSAAELNEIYEKLADKKEKVLIEVQRNNAVSFHILDPNK